MGRRSFPLTRCAARCAGALRGSGDRVQEDEVGVQACGALGCRSSGAQSARPPPQPPQSVGSVVDSLSSSADGVWAWAWAQIIVGENEWQNGTVRVKQLATREEGDVLLADL